MERTIVQGLIIVLLFAATFFAINQIDWMGMLDVKANTAKTEEKLGELFWDAIRNSETEKTDKFIVDTIDSLLSDLCTKNFIDRDRIKLHIIEKDEVNAFALPGRHLVLYTGLINASDNFEEVTGVIGHELAHIELNHVMKRLVREIGLSALISMTTGESNPQIILETAKLLSSSAFDRALEKEADIKASDYLLKSNINPEHFANFLFRMASGESTSEYNMASWISTHPDSEERAKYVIDYSKDHSVDDRKLIAEKTWLELREKLKTP